MDQVESGEDLLSDDFQQLIDSLFTQQVPKKALQLFWGLVSDLKSPCLSLDTNALNGLAMLGLASSSVAEHIKSKDEFMEKVLPMVPKFYNKLFSNLNCRLASEVSVPTTRLSSWIFPQLKLTRFSQDFDEIGLIGKGGFGTVVVARNKTDLKEYAIKKIFFKDRACFSSTRFVKLMREVFTLSQLDHPNVVRYFSAWVEEAESRDSLLDEVRLEKQQQQQQQKFLISSVDSGSHMTSWSADSTFCSASSSLSPSFTSIPLLNPLDSQLVSTFSPSSESRSKLSLVLYIQMQLYDPITLKEWLRRRKEIDFEQCKQIFRQIAEGVRHVHSRQILHRDLKPANIFLCSQSGSTDQAESVPQIKIGDFGLSIFDSSIAKSTSDSAVRYSTSSPLSTSPPPTFLSRTGPEMTCGSSKSNASLGSMCSPPANGSSISEKSKALGGQEAATSPPPLSCTSGCLPCSLSPDGSSSSGLIGLLCSSSTKDVGTPGYVAPEIQSPDSGLESYSEKVDIYSLGIILFEIFCLWKTKHERALDLMNLKRGLFPSAMGQHHRNTTWLIGLIRQMVSKDPELRPSIHQVLEHPFLRNNDDVWLLQEKIKEQQSVIQELEKRIRGLELSNVGEACVFNAES